MKKITAILLCLALIFIPSLAGAADITVSFVVGETTMRVGDRTVNIEQTYMTDNVTMIPLRAVSEIFGTQVDYNGAEQKITVTYETMEVLLWIGNTNAMVNGQSIAINRAPELKNGVTMVPARFLCETLGAQIGYNAQTGQITITKSKAKSTDDLKSTLLAENGQSKGLGDSYHGWSMDLPDYMLLANRLMDGSETLVQSVKDGSYIYIQIVENNGLYTLASVKNLEENSALRYTYVDQLTGTSPDGTSYVKTQFHDSRSFVDSKVYVTDAKLFVVQTVAPLTVDEGTRKTYIRTSDSFTCRFQDGYKDISSVQNGKVRYDNGSLALAFDVPVGWQNLENPAVANLVTFVKGTSIYDAEGVIYVEICSIKEGVTCEALAGRQRDFAANYYNPGLYTVSELKKREISGTEAAYYTVAYEKGQARTYELDMFLYIGSYCYKLTVASTDMDDEAFKMVAESFNVAALDAEATGKLMGVQPPDYSETTPYVNEENGYSLEIPVSWGPSGYGAGIVDSILDITLNVIPAYADGKTLEEAAKKNAQQLESVLSLGEMKQTTVGGYPAYKMEIAETEEEAAAQGDYTAIYVVDGKNGVHYLIIVSIGEDNYTPQTVKLAEGVLASFRALPLPAREELPQEEEGPKKTFDPFA